MLKKLVATLIVAVFLGASTPAFAEDNTMRKTFQNAYYGGLVGALIGAAAMVLTDEPEDHWDYIAKGAALGVIGGTAYGLSKDTIMISAAEVEDGKLKLSVPTVVSGASYDDATRRKESHVRTNLFGYRF